MSLGASQLKLDPRGAVGSVYNLLLTPGVCVGGLKFNLPLSHILSISLLLSLTHSHLTRIQVCVSD